MAAPRPLEMPAGLRRLSVLHGRDSQAFDGPRSGWILTSALTSSLSFLARQLGQPPVPHGHLPALTTRPRSLPPFAVFAPLPFSSAPAKTAFVSNNISCSVYIIPQLNIRILLYCQQAGL